MNLLKRLFKSKTKESWTRLADEMDGQFIKRTFSGAFLGESDKVLAKVNGWTITLDIETRGSSGGPGGSPIYYTRMQAFYISETDFLFIMRPMSAVSRRWKQIGMQDIEVGDPEFDRDFRVKGNDESAVRVLFGEPTIRRSLESQWSISSFGEPTIRRLLELQRSISSFSLQVTRRYEFEVPGHPESRIYKLQFSEQGRITDIPRLKSIFELLAATLNRLRNMGLASEAKSYRLRQVGLDDSEVQEISRLSKRFRTW